jgi:hypothetical protein
LIPVCLGFLFSSIAGNLVGTVALPRTLKTIFAKLDIKDDFVEHPVCFKCHRIFPPGVGPETFCPDCEEEIFQGITREDSDSDPWNELISDTEDSKPPTGSAKRKPVVVAPIQLLSSVIILTLNCYPRAGAECRHIL